jgi:hypothetical protein
MEFPLLDTPTVTYSGVAKLTIRDEHEAHVACRPRPSFRLSLHKDEKRNIERYPDAPRTPMSSNDAPHRCSAIDTGLSPELLSAILQTAR